MVRLLVSLALSLIAAAPAFAEVRIGSDPGGAIDEYLHRFSRLRQSNERVVIDGACLSACTLVLAKIPRDRICVTRRAVLGFHAPFRVDGNGRTYRTSHDIREMTATYPAPVRAWIRRKGGLNHRFIFLRGRELTALYPRC